jgi:hypothetical protein
MDTYLRITLSHLTPLQQCHDLPIPSHREVLSGTTAVLANEVDSQDELTSACVSRVLLQAETKQKLRPLSDFQGVSLPWYVMEQAFRLAMFKPEVH